MIKVIKSYNGQDMVESHDLQSSEETQHIEVLNSLTISSLTRETEDLGRK